MCGAEFLRDVVVVVVVLVVAESAVAVVGVAPLRRLIPGVGRRLESTYGLTFETIYWA